MTTDLSRESILKTSRKFTEARILITGVELDLFTLLSEEPLSAEDITSKLKTDPRATTILLDVLAAQGYLIKEKGRYRTDPAVAPLLSADSDNSLVPGLMHTAHLWTTWTQLTRIVREGGPAENLEIERQDYMKAFIEAMHIGSARLAPDIVKAVRPGKAKALLDVGGGSGSYTIAFLQAVSGMRATIFDQPDVIPMARERIAGEGLLDRVELVSGDYHEDELPSGHDFAFLSAVIHQNSHEQNVELYRKVFDTLDPGGRIVIRDYVLNYDRTEPVSGALFAVNMLVNTDGGNSYTLEEIREGLSEAGFVRVKLLQEKEMSSLVEAYKE